MAKLRAIEEIWLFPKVKVASRMGLVSSADTLFNEPMAVRADQDLSAKLGEQMQSSKYVDQVYTLGSDEDLSRRTPRTVFQRSRIYKNASLHLIRTAMEQLKVILSTYNSKSKSHVEHPTYRTMEARYGASAVNYDLVVLDRKRSDYDKLERNVKEIIWILKDLDQEISTFSTSTCLDVFADIHFDMKTDEEQLMLEVERKKFIYEDLLHGLQHNRENMKIIFDQMNDEVSLKSAEFKNLEDYLRTVKTYTKSWENARKEQNSIVLGRQESNSKACIDDMTRQMYLEDVCNSSIECYYKEAINDHVEEIQRFMEVYDAESDECDIRIYELRRETEKVTEKKERLQHRYNERQEEIEEWLEYKRVKKEREERLALEMGASTKIQAWWRGTMFRKGLGPYRKKQKGKKGDKKKKKNKK